MRQQVAAFRQASGIVELRAGLTPGASRRSVGRLIADLLPLSSGHRIIVSPPADTQTRVRISVVPAPAKEQLDLLGDRLDGSLHADVEDFRAVLLLNELPVSG